MLTVLARSLFVMTHLTHVLHLQSLVDAGDLDLALDVAVVQNFCYLEQSGPAAGDFVCFAWDLVLGPVALWLV